VCDGSLRSCTTIKHAKFNRAGLRSDIVGEFESEFGVDIRFEGARVEKNERRETVDEDRY